MIFEIEDAAKRTWYLAMVGGFGVGSIQIDSTIGIGSSVEVGQEIGKFNLGSTVCLAWPIEAKIEAYLQSVQVGEKVKG
jgi:phosphatidylserine decarboxylase